MQQTHLTESLRHIAALAVCAIRGAECGSVMVFENDDRPDTHAGDSTLVRTSDALQVCINEGPTLTAATDVRVARSGSLEWDGQWPRFGPGAAALGMHSALAIPLTLGRHPIGVITVYTHQEHAYTASAVTIGEHFALQAAISASNAQALAALTRRRAAPSHTIPST